MLSLAVPIHFYAGPLRLSPYRAVVILLFLPCIVAWLSGQLGRIRLPDVLILLACLWGSLALVVNHGLTASWETSGILLIETFGSYLLARKLIRSEDDFLLMVRILFCMICVLLPFAAYESITDRAPLLELLGGQKNHAGTRLGFYRSQVLFDNSILYGVFCASAFGVTYYCLARKTSRLGLLVRVAVVSLATFFSVTAGALVALNSQIGFAAWDYMTRTIRHRWRLLGLLAVAAYVFVDVLSNRTPFHVFITYLTFSPRSGHGRILIFKFGSAEVMRNPLFGIGLGDWERPAWMTDSVDNFWLVIAMRYGLPAFVCLAGAVALIMRGLGQVRLEDEQIRACRAGILVSLGGLVIAAATVHYWNALYSWFLFMLGSSVWMLDRSSEPGQPRTTQSNSTKRSMRGN